MTAVAIVLGVLCVALVVLVGLFARDRARLQAELEALGAHITQPGVGPGRRPASPAALHVGRAGDAPDAAHGLAGARARHHRAHPGHGGGPAEPGPPRSVRTSSTWPPPTARSPCSSPTSRTPRRSTTASATRPGSRCWPPTTGCCGRGSRSTAARWSRPPATGSWSPSATRRRPAGQRSASSGTCRATRRCAGTARSRCGSASTPARWSPATATTSAATSRWRHGWPTSPGAGRCWSATPCARRWTTTRRSSWRSTTPSSLKGLPGEHVVWEILPKP
ncbi:hypothetical protein [Nocardioides convexus]|uniref:hypothetical protein n=1 Tax=Nocardioides convexus TaxID=2712224 RepID=UPI0024188FE0|nr:hypothetical protein [Nocardioides convexus]